MVVALSVAVFVWLGFWLVYWHFESRFLPDDAFRTMSQGLWVLFVLGLLLGALAVQCFTPGG